MPGIDFSRLRTDITMQHVLELVGFECVRRRAEQWYGYCPLHESTTKHRRSFSVNLTKGCYYCHTCHSHGDQFKLWAEVTRLPIRQATIELCNRLGHKIPWMQTLVNSRIKHGTEKRPSALPVKTENAKNRDPV